MKKFLNGILALTASVVVFAVSGNVRAEDKIDELTNSSFGIGAVTNYKDVIFDSLSGASYKANAAGSNGTIQLRSKNSNSGIVTTVSAGHVSKIELKWNAKQQMHLHSLIFMVNLVLIVLQLNFIIRHQLVHFLRVL